MDFFFSPQEIAAIGDTPNRRKADFSSIIK